MKKLLLTLATLNLLTSITLLGVVVENRDNKAIFMVKSGSRDGQYKRIDPEGQVNIPLEENNSLWIMVNLPDPSTPPPLQLMAQVQEPGTSPIERVQLSTAITRTEENPNGIVLIRVWDTSKLRATYELDMKTGTQKRR